MTDNKYIIKYSCGYGENMNIVEASSLGEAEQIAYEECRQDAEYNMTYEAEAINAEELENYGYDPEDYGLERTHPEDW